MNITTTYDEAMVKAMKLALEALETISVDVKTTSNAYEAQRQAITALREALAQPEQKPVAWMVYTQDGQSVYVTDSPTDIQENQRALPLYATPQRTWVGLTDEERDEICLGDEGIARAIEAKLRSKNT